MNVPHFSKSPEACEKLQEIRQEIDAIDQDVVRLLGWRFEYVKAAARFKTTAQSVNADERVNSMLQQRRVWAEQAGIAPEIIEKLYRELIQYFIQEEMRAWQKQQVSAGNDV